MILELSRCSRPKGEAGRDSGVQDSGAGGAKKVSEQAGSICRRVSRKTGWGGVG